VRSLEALLNKASTIPASGGGTPIIQKPKSEPSITRPSNPTSYPKMSETISTPAPEGPSKNNNIDVTPCPKADGPLNMDFITANWPGFCSLVSKNKKVIFGYLSLCSVAKFEDNVLTLLVESESKMQFEQLSKSDCKQFLEGLLQDYFGTPIKLMLTQGNSTRKSISGTTGVAPGADPSKFFDGMPEGKNLFDQLGGEIIGQ
jgi:hypothetical protein